MCYQYLICVFVGEKWITSGYFYFGTWQILKPQTQNEMNRDLLAQFSYSIEKKCPTRRGILSIHLTEVPNRNRVRTFPRLVDLLFTH